MITEKKNFWSFNHSALSYTRLTYQVSCIQSMGSQNGKVYSLPLIRMEIKYLRALPCFQLRAFVYSSDSGTRISRNFPRSVPETVSINFEESQRFVETEASEKFYYDCNLIS